MFYKNDIVYYNVYSYYCGSFIEKHVYTKFRLDWCCVSELHAYICPHRNVCPEAVYCCFTRTTMFTKILTDVTIMFVMDLYQCAKFHFLTLYGF